MSKALRRRPLILLMSDIFTVPRVMRPDILVDADPYIEQWADALDCQVSQFYGGYRVRHGCHSKLPQ